MSYAGVDIGGTYMRFLYLQKRFDVYKIKTPKTLAGLEKAITDYIGGIGKNARIRGLGIAIPGVIDSKKLKVEQAPHISFLSRWNMQKFQKKLKIPVRIENDAKSFLRAEAAFGSARGKKRVVGIVVGTGIGGALIEAGKITSGAHNAAGEIGHMIMDLYPKKEFEALGAKAAFLQKGDRSEIIGLGVANLVNAFDPELVVIGGGAADKLNLRAIRRILKQRVLSPRARRVPVRFAVLGEAAQAIGAALLFKK